MQPIYMYETYLCRKDFSVVPILWLASLALGFSTAIPVVFREVLVSIFESGSHFPLSNLLSRL